MIGILSNEINVISDKNFLKEIGEYIFINEDDDVSGLFIDWVPKLPKYKDAWIKQASLLQQYIKIDKPIVIFDRYFSLDKKEYEWLKKFNITLLEPALMGRKGFNYLPEWIDSMDIQTIYRDTREFDLVFEHDNIEFFMKGFDYWFRDFARIFHDKKVAYSTNEITDFKKKELEENNLIYWESKEKLFLKGNSTVAFHNDISYKIGHFNKNYFNAMRLGCIPFLPAQHRYFHGLFKGLVIENLNDLDNYIKMFGRVRAILVEDIFEKIRKEWEEFTVEYAVNLIRENLS